MRPAIALGPPTSTSAPCSALRQLRRRLQIALAERQAAKTLRQRIGVGEIESADAAAIVEHDEALQHIVDLIEPDFQLHGRVALDVRLIFVQAEAAGRQQDSFEREIGGLGLTAAATAAAKATPQSRPARATEVMASSQIFAPEDQRRRVAGIREVRRRKRGVITSMWC